MPSSKTALTAKIADLEAQIATAKAEALTLRMQISAMEAVLAMQNGAMDDMGKLIELMPGGLVAKLAFVLERHGVKIARPAGSPWQ